MLWWCHGTSREGLATPWVMSWWILTLGSLLVWLRWLKKPMKPLGMSKKPLASWRRLEGVLRPTLNGVMIFQPLLGHGGLVWWWWWWPCMVLNRLWNPWTCPWYDEESHEDLEPLMKTLIPLQRSWSPLLALDVVRWHDSVFFGDLMKSWNLVKTLMPISCTWCS